MIKLYSNGCPKCKVLKSKLASKNIEYTECNDIEEMKSLGIQFLPVLKNDNELLDFKAATEWIGRQ